MDPAYRDLAAESAFEYGSRAGVWRVERLLTTYRLPITVFTCAVAIERNPEVGASIREAGHEPCSHGWRWGEVWTLSPEQDAEHIRMAIASIQPDREGGRRRVHDGRPAERGYPARPRAVDLDL